MLRSITWVASIVLCNLIIFSHQLILARETETQYKLHSYFFTIPIFWFTGISVYFLPCIPLCTICYNFLSDLRALYIYGPASLPQIFIWQYSQAQKNKRINTRFTVSILNTVLVYVQYTRVVKIARSVCNINKLFQLLRTMLQAPSRIFQIEVEATCAY